MEQTITTVAGDSARYVKKPTSAIPITTPAATPLAGMHKPCLTLTMRNTQAINCHTPHAIRTPASSLKNMLPSSGNNKDQKSSSELNWNNNLRIYRYSETLLNAAELITRGAGQGDAKKYLNLVHKRAGLVTEIEPTLDNIIEERHLEFVGEGKRYWDLIRTGKAASVLVPDAYGYRTNSWSSSKKYLPIPQKEIDAAKGTLVQNNY